MFREFAEYSAAHGVMEIAMPFSKRNPSPQSIAEEYRLSIYVYTVNGLEQGMKLWAAGVSAIYTGSLRTPFGPWRSDFYGKRH